MNKIGNWISLGLRSILFLYIPTVSLVLVLYQIVFGTSMNLHWSFTLLYLGLLVQWMHEKFQHQSLEEEIDGQSHLERTLSENGWEIIDRRRDTLTVRPTFDVPFNLVINDKVEIHYTDQTAKIEGPLHYVTALSKAIKGEPVKKKWTVFRALKATVTTGFILLPFITQSGLLWEIKVMRHNVEAAATETDIKGGSVAGISVQNINNNGIGVENDEHIFYSHGNNTLIKTDNELNYEKLLMKGEPYYRFENLNLAGDWLYYTRDESLFTMKTDGTNEQILYDLGYIEDVHVTENGICFINTMDNYNVYHMDLNGGNLERLLDVEARDIAVYGDELLVSHEEVVERLSLDGSERDVILNESANDLVRHDGYYYYIGSDDKLYKSTVDGTSGSVTLVDRPIGTYTLTDDKIIYTLRSDDDFHPSHGVHLTDHTGSKNERVYASSNVESLIKVGDSILFNASGTYNTLEMMRYDLTDGQVGEIFID
ncbi:MAG: DUF5050 domain-containing protein [Alkalibacterium sp.]|uniref:DUF5050 domain-containing protein n=1 Tax=Alkalibacterium sp. TaxID=1872447 RepID=UPI0039710BD8